MAFIQKHELYKKGDPDIPDVILDRNGDVVLGLCKICGRGEIELEEPCTLRRADDVPFGRQLQPVRVTITGGEMIDRSYWRGRIEAFLANQPCCTNQQPTTKEEVVFIIYPDANND